MDRSQGFDNEVFKKNLKKFFAYKDMSQKEFCSSTGYKQSTLSSFFQDKNRLPRLDLIIALLTIEPGLNIYWLLFGRGEMFMSETETESEIVETLLKTNNYLMEEIKRLKKNT